MFACNHPINDLLENLNAPLRISISQSISLNFNQFRAREKPVRCTHFAQILQAVGDGEGAVGFAFLADAVGLEGVGEVRSVVIAFFQLEPARLQILLSYASEADVLNMALVGQTAAQWRGANPCQKGNIRDQATCAQLVCLSNLENLNALFTSQGQAQLERLIRLNQTAIQQMKLLTADERTPWLPEGKKGK